MQAPYSLVAPRVTWDTVRPPFLVIRLANSMYTLHQLPPALDREALLALGWRAVEQFQRLHKVCVVFGWLDGAFLDPDGTVRWSFDLPSGGMLLDPAPEFMDFLPLQLYPGQERHDTPVVYAEPWKWWDRLREATEAMGSLGSPATVVH